MRKLILSALVVGSLFATSCKKAKEAGQGLTDGATSLVKDGANVVADGANAAVDGAKSGANAMVDGAKTGANAMVDGAKTGASAMVDGAKSGANAMVDGAKTGANAIADKATGAMSSALGGIKIPEFADAKVGEHLTSYAAYAKEYVAAGAVKSPALLAKGTDLVAKGKTLLSGLDAGSATKFKTVMSAIQSKMAPAK